jgi:CRP-like cAMP-binding protein
VGEGKSILQFKKDQNLFVQGEPADTVFFHSEGQIRFVRTGIDPDGIGAMRPSVGP